MIYETIRITLPTGRQKGALEILGRYAERTRFLVGCASCRLYHDEVDPKTIMLEEVWKAEDDLNSHLASASYQEVLLVMEMASSEPEVKFIAFSEYSGLERIQQARMGGSRPELFGDSFPVNPREGTESGRKDLAKKR